MNCGIQTIRLLTGAVIVAGCVAASKPASTVLPAPGSTNPAAVRHNEEGIQAYSQKQ